MIIDSNEIKCCPHRELQPMSFALGSKHYDISVNGGYCRNLCKFRDYSDGDYIGTNLVNCKGDQQ